MQSEHKAIFLDRDGVLIRERGDYTFLLEDVSINEGVFDALRIFLDAGFKLIVISNQSGISKGLYTQQQADFIHFHLNRNFAAKKIYIEEFYYCPHHPDITNCICRKPDSQLLEKAIARFDIDVRNSWFIGDADRDVEAGDKIFLNTYKIEVNASLVPVAEKIVNRNK